MADSGNTKRLLAQSLKQLLQAQPLCKISIGEICEQCGMNRKSFYYHFHDKYDLIIWIFETEFLAKSRGVTYASSWEFLFALCSYFEHNRIFYRRALEISGQNSLDEHLRSLVHPAVIQLFPGLSEGDPRLLFYVHYYSDAFLAAIRRWLNENLRWMQPASCR